MVQIHSMGRGSSILSRASFDASIQLSTAQLQMDQAISSFSHQAGDVSSIAAMTAGSLAFSFTRLGILSLPLQSFRGLSSLASLMGLGTEVLAFRTVYHQLQSLSGEQSPESILNSQGFFRDLLQFGTLKLLGSVAQGQNLLLTHGVQASSLVAANQITSALGLTPRPQGSWVEQLSGAEILNLQMNAGMALAGLATGNRLSVLESHLKLQTHVLEQSSRGSPLLGARNLFQFAFHPALEGPHGEELGHAVFMSAPSDGELTRLAAPPPRSEASPEGSREAVLQSIQDSISPLGKIWESLEALHRGIALHLGEAPESHPEYARWMEERDHVLTRQLEVSREYHLAEGIFAIGGGAKIWEVPRLEAVHRSLLRTLDRSRHFYESREYLSELPSLKVELENIPLRSFKELRRLYERLSLPSALASRLFDRFSLAKRTEDAFLLNGLEGLEGLISRGGRDEQQALIAYLERIVSLEPPDAEAFNHLLILGMNYQQGLMGRPSVMEIIIRTNQFHLTYPQAQGPFIEIFYKMHALGSGEAASMAHVLHFARTHLEQGERVTLEMHGHFGVAVMITQRSSGEEFRYGIVPILNELHDTSSLNAPVDRALIAVLSAQERKGDHLPIRLHVPLPRLTRRVAPELLRGWGADYLSAASQRVRTILANAELRRSVENRTETLAPLALRALRESIQEAWRTRPLEIAQLEVASYSRPQDAEGRILRGREDRTDRLANRLEVFNAGTLSREADIARLQDQIAFENPSAQEVLLLFRLLEDAGRQREAVGVLREGIKKFRKNKGLVSRFRESFVKALETISLGEDKTLGNPQVSKLLSTYLGVSVTPDLLNSMFVLCHPLYKFDQIQVDRRGNALQFSLVIKDAALKDPDSEEAIGEISLEIEYSEQERAWFSNLRSFRLEEKHQQQGVGLRSMDVFFDFLRCLGIPKMILSSEVWGPYVWLRMGGEFSQMNQFRMTRNALYTYLADQSDQEKVDLPRLLPHPDLFNITPGQLLENLMALRTLRPHYFRTFILERVSDINYEFDLRDNSPSYRRFRAYYAQRFPPSTSSAP